jgi:hypothetical protein
LPPTLVTESANSFIADKLREAADLPEQQHFYADTQPEGQRTVVTEAAGPLVPIFSRVWSSSFSALRSGSDACTSRASAPVSTTSKAPAARARAAGAVAAMRSRNTSCHNHTATPPTSAPAKNDLIMVWLLSSVRCGLPSPLTEARD